MESDLYKILNHMPKGGLHNLTSIAALPVEFYIKLTYHESVYFNEREKLFKVAPNGLEEDGYVKCVDMRRFWSSADKYDHKLREYLRMAPADCEAKESHVVWAHYQHKFSMINELANYREFFK